MKEENDPIVCIGSAQRRIKQARERLAYSEYLDEADLMLQRALVLLKGWQRKPVDDYRDWDYQDRLEARSVEE